MNHNTLIPHVLISLKLALPLLVLLAAAVAVLVAEALRPAARRLLSAIPVLGCVAALAALLATPHMAEWSREGLRLYFFGALCTGAPIVAAQAIILGAVAFVALISPRYLEGRLIPQGEYYALLLLAATGMLALAASAELLALFLNLELLSIPLYILTGLEKRNAPASEAAFKYFLLGSFAAAFLLLGIAFVFGATGFTEFSRIGDAITTHNLKQPLFLALGFGLVFVGFGFKLTLAPFHMYAPDVYDGAPAPVAALIATGSKVAGFTVLFNFASLTYGMLLHLTPLWLALYAIAALGMIIGNVGAVVQPGFKRMLAYSSIAHSSYLLIPIVILVKQPQYLDAARAALIYYLLAYTVMTLIAFGVAAALGRAGEGDIASYRGLGRRAPWLAVALTLALLSLVGLPPTIGFFGKFRIFSLAVQSGHLGLALIGVVSSVASAFYYLRVIVTMYMHDPLEGEAALPAASRAGTLALSLAALGIFALIFVTGL